MPRSKTRHSNCRAGRTIHTLAAGLSISAAACLGAAYAQSGGESHAGLPDLSGFWNHSVAAIDFESPPGGGPGPVQNMQSFEGRYAVWVGDYRNPILQPWAAEAVKLFGEMELEDRGPPTAQMLCMPSGVPNAHTLMGPVQFLQSPDVVLIVHQRDHQIRRVYLNRAHSENLEPSWYGESVGHYEGGTLVVDTIGLNDRTVTDRNGTPHTEALHVIERYRVVDDGGTVEVQFHVEDPGAFTTPWSAMIRYQRVRNQDRLEEYICPENNRDAVTSVSVPIPVAETPDF